MCDISSSMLLSYLYYFTYHYIILLLIISISWTACLPLPVFLPACLPTLYHIFISFYIFRTTKQGWHQHQPNPHFHGTGVVCLLPVPDIAIAGHRVNLPLLDVNLVHQPANPQISRSHVYICFFSEMKITVSVMLRSFDGVNWNDMDRPSSHSVLAREWSQTTKLI